jgi:prepilin-type N-terminal cleavage/methylation domain-containing protein
MVTARRPDAAFTLTETMVVLVILSLLAALSTPLFTRDNNARKGRDWAKIVAQLLQRARFQAMGDRANIHVLLYRTRVDMYRQEVAGTFTLLSSTKGLAADDTKTVAIWDAKQLSDCTASSTLPTGQNLPTGTPAVPTSSSTNDIVFTSVGSAVAPSDGTTPVNWCVYLRNELLPAGHPDASFVVTIKGLTGYITSNDKVTLQP